MKTNAANLMGEMFEAAIASAQPQLCVLEHMPLPEEVKGRLIVIGAGKKPRQLWRVQ